VFLRNLPLKGLVVMVVLVGAAVAVPAGASASMSMPMPMKPQPTMASRPAPPLPNGVYKGTTNRGARVTIRVGASAPDGVIRGTFQVGCVPGKASFQSPTGMFTGRSGSFTATGSFDIDHVSGRITLAGHRGCAGTSYYAKLSSPAGVTKTVVRYSPLTLNPMSMAMPMSSSMFNMMGGMQDYFLHGVQKPCSSCYVVGMVPNLVYPNGKIANYNTGAMLHHFVLFNSSEHDVTCPTWPQRFFASGNERTPMVLPAGYGYPVVAGANWNMLVELMNMSMKTQHLQVQITFYTMPTSAHLHAVTPMWLDENECGNSEYSIPAGHSDKVWNYKVPATIAGDIVATSGHVHDYGTHISVTDTTSGKLICSSRAGYGEIAAYDKNIDHMSGCTGDPLAVIHAGDTLRLDSYYNSPIAEKGVMGIMIAYVDVGAFKAPHAQRGNGR
jgi:hypothetical protein